MTSGLAPHRVEDGLAQGAAAPRGPSSAPPLRYPLSMNTRHSLSGRARFGSPLVLLASAVGAASFLYPFLLPALAGVGSQAGHGGVEVPLLFSAVGLVCLLVILTRGPARAGTPGGSKLVALLGMLVAVDATLRLVPTLLGASPIFLLIVLVGFSYGADLVF